jgi:3-phenylpropionate/trans-cinnamate dioxygenase ferredoxin subunit
VADLTSSGSGASSPETPDRTTLRRVAVLDELSIGEMRRIEVAGRALCLARLDDGTIFAIEDRCSHEAETLSEGVLVGCEVECPWHLGRFDVRSGAPVAPPPTEPVATFPVVIDGDNIFVDTGSGDAEVADGRV